MFSVCSKPSLLRYNLSQPSAAEWALIHAADARAKVAEAWVVGNPGQKVVYAARDLSAEFLTSYYIRKYPTEDLDNRYGKASQHFQSMFGYYGALRHEYEAYGRERMDRTARRLVIVVVAVAALGYFFYKFRNSITLEGFHWSMVWESLRDANLGLLVLALVVIYGCFAIRAIRWNWLAAQNSGPRDHCSRAALNA
jgi:hypothetical protein